MLMPFAIRQSVSTIEWSVERSIGEGFGKEGFGKSGGGWPGWPVANAHPMYFEPRLHR